MGGGQGDVKTPPLKGLVLHGVLKGGNDGQRGRGAKLDFGGGGQGDAKTPPPLKGLLLRGVLKGGNDGQWGGGVRGMQNPPPLKVCYCMES